ncbi:leukocyte surface antigen CD47 isoform X2 [Candoia aspera]|uniref:leukocyte surface antigen CD47 isoform X2 n=1 Tax=Candoia aspera TaxID=51853 RepID=UPI002FD854ED
MWVLRVCWVLLGTLGAGSAQLFFESVPFVDIDPCNGTVVTLPCVVTNLKYNQSSSMFVTWLFQGKQFFIFDGVTNNTVRNRSFQSAIFENRSMLPYGIASLVVSTEEALPGNYTCEVTESNREGETRIELRNSSVPWFQPMERCSIISTIMVAVALYWCQFITVAIKFDMTFKKKIGLSAIGGLLSCVAVIGAILFAQGGYTSSVKAGLGIIVVPVIIVVPLLYFLFTSVFERPRWFARFLLGLKAIGYLTAVVGFAFCVRACHPKNGSVLIAGLAVIDVAAVIGLIYIIIIIGSNLKDHQPPRHLM